jgi:hypothetical protein
MSEAFVTIPGLDAIRKDIERMGDQIVEKANKAIYRGAERASTKAKATFAPISPPGTEQGELRASIHVEKEGDAIALVAGGPSAPYAHEVHEDFVWHKKNVGKGFLNINWTKPGSGPKFLERPAIEEAEKIGEELKDIL